MGTLALESQLAPVTFVRIRTSQFVQNSRIRWRTIARRKFLLVRGCVLQMDEETRLIFDRGFRGHPCQVIPLHSKCLEQLTIASAGGGGIERFKSRHRIRPVPPALPPLAPPLA